MVRRCVRRCDRSAPAYQGGLTRMTNNFRNVVRGVTLAAIAVSGAAFVTSAFAQKVAVITPYMAQPGTQAYVESFQAVAKEKGWDVNVIDTAGDVAAVISRIEDAVNSKVDAIVIN